MQRKSRPFTKGRFFRCCFILKILSHFNMISAPDHGFFMKKALLMAEIAFSNGEVPVGAVMVCDEKIITKTHNQTELLNDATAHAEMMAITSACAYFNSKYLTTCTLYVSIEPCPMCAAALYWAQIKMVVWGASDKKRGCTLYSPGLLHPSTEMISGILESESSAIMKQFFKEKRGG